ncbi:MAG: FtsW/RodA/SpoVE family cell cycle protein [Anaerolineales bacterium]
MGYGVVKRNRRAAPPNTGLKEPVLGKPLVRLGVDVPLILILFTLLVFGTLMVYSASWDFSRTIYDSPTHIFTRQLLWIGLGIVIAIGCAFLDYHYWRRLAVPAMLVSILGLAAVLVTNEVRFGAARTLIKGSYQPSELAKLVIIIYLAVWLFSKCDHLGDVNFGLLPLAAILGIVGGLIFLQPDLSAVFTVIALGGLMFFLAGGEMRQIALLLAVTIIVGWMVVKASPTGRARVDSYLEGVRDPTEASYHVRRSLEALVKGGWIGVGIGKAGTKLTGLPVPPTDSIFAVIGEETGVIGATGVIVLYGLLLWRGLETARRAPDLLGALLAGGLSLWIVMEAFVNMAVMVGLAPFAGNALPFISAGGSSMMVSMAAVGIIINVSRLGHKMERESTKTLNPVIDFRARKTYRVTTVSRSGRKVAQPLRDTRPMAGRPGIFRRR